MKTIKTKLGAISYEIKNKHNATIFDSIGRILFNSDKQTIKERIKEIKKAENIDDWLETFDDVCWGKNIKNIIENARDYQRCNGREFDIEWFAKNYNRIGDTYIMFEYSDCFI